MCRDCACGQPAPEPSAAQAPERPGEEDSATRILPLHTALLQRNDAQASALRQRFAAAGVRAVNLLSSPGSGKTALLERTLRVLPRAAAVVGDLQTENDADRLRATGAQAVQITTGATCHLDAHMVLHALEQLDADNLDFLFIENVGNLVCPASYDLGEDRRVVLLSVTEGEDKPLKYPVIFRNADLVLITKSDLAEAVEFDSAQARDAITRVAPKARILDLSAKTGDGFEAWLDWLRA